MWPKLLIALIIFGSSAIADNSVSGRTDVCNVEAVFKVKDGTYYAVERQANHGGEQAIAHVANWTEWSNGFPVIHYDHSSLMESTEVFDQDSGYVHAVYVDPDDKVYVAVKDGKIRIFERKDRTFNFQKVEDHTQFFPHLTQIDKEEGLKFMRILSMTYVTGPLKEHERIIVNSWHHRKNTSSSNKNAIVEARLLTNKKMERYFTIASDASSVKDPLINVLHYERSIGHEQDEVIQGVYGIWSWARYSKNAEFAMKPARSADWHVTNSLMGCHQLLCFDGDVDAITNTPMGGYVIFRGCYVWVGKWNDVLPDPSLIRKTVWQEVGCNVHAAMLVNNQLYLFKEGYFIKCDWSSSNIKCDKPVAIRTVFPGVENVTAATVAPNGDVWLLYGQPTRYSIFSFKGGSTATNKVSNQYLYYKWKFLPEVIDDIITRDKDMHFFSGSFNYKIPEGSRAKVAPKLQPFSVFRCPDNIYQIGDYLSLSGGESYRKWRQEPQAAKAPHIVAADDAGKSTEFNWLWLLLLLLLLLPLLCLVPCRKSRDAEDPKAPHESVFSRSALGTALSGFGGDPDVRSSMSNQPSGRSPASGFGRSGIANVSTVPLASGMHRSHMSNSKPNHSGLSSKRSGLSGASALPGMRPKSGSSHKGTTDSSRRSGMSNASADPKKLSSGTSGTSRSNLSNSSGTPSGTPSNLRSGLSRGSSGRPGSSTNRSNLTGGSSGRSMGSDGSKRSGLSQVSNG